MRRMTPLQSWLSKVFVLGVYILFFAVQLHLRYIISPNTCSTGIVPYSSWLSQKSIDSNVTTPDKQENKPVTALNKRFFPQPLAEIALPQFDLKPEVFIILQDLVISFTPSLQGTAPTTRFQRGPPSLS